VSDILEEKHAEEDKKNSKFYQKIAKCSSPIFKHS